MIRIGIRLDDNGIRVNAVSEGDDGETVVKVHRNKRRKMALSASIHLPISDHMSWEDGLRCLGIQGDAVAHSIPIADVVPDRRGGQGTAVPSCQYRHDDTHASGEDDRRIREGMCVGGGDIPDIIHIHDG